MSNFVKIGPSIAEKWQFFHVLRWRPYAILDLENCDFKCSGIRTADALHMSNFVKIGLNNGCGDIVILQYSKMAAVRHLVFRKLRF